jgi:hypothetical protein
MCDLAHVQVQQQNDKQKFHEQLKNIQNTRVQERTVETVVGSLYEVGAGFFLD